MAPWNIVFRGGSLEYIDYDTKDHPLTKILPFAYQVKYWKSPRVGRTASCCAAYMRANSILRVAPASRHRNADHGLLDEL